ncbi:MAG TPA: hypothetical protein VJA87_03830 [Candidatus Paceibacterota bacterium]
MNLSPKWFKIFFAIFPFVSLFFFPWPMTLVASFAAGIVFPPLALIVGVLVDVLYSPGEGLFVGTLWGAGLAALAYGVRYFVRTRIM